MSRCYALGGHVVTLTRKGALPLQARCALFGKVLLDLCKKRIPVCLESKDLVTHTSLFCFDVAKSAYEVLDVLVDKASRGSRVGPASDVADAIGVD